MIDEIVDMGIELSNTERGLKDKILEMAEKYLFDDIRYSETEVAKKIKSEVCKEYDI